MFISAAPDGGGCRMSTDGLVWEACPIANNNWQSIKFGNGHFVITTGSKSNQIKDPSKQVGWSVDGKSWQYSTIPNWNGDAFQDDDGLLSFGNGMFVLP